MLRSLGLIEVGRLTHRAARVVAANLQSFVGIDVDILTPVRLPEEAFQRHRRQYDAGLVLKHLGHLSLPEHVRILALTPVDLCNPILTYVFGEAEMGGKMAIVSDFRLRKNEDGTPTSLDGYYNRLAKVALHEIGHTFSLYHCETPKCLMQFSPRLGHLDGIDTWLCRRCEFMLHESLKANGFR